MPFPMRPVRAGRGSRTLSNSHRPAEAQKEVGLPFQAKSFSVFTQMQQLICE